MPAGLMPHALAAVAGASLRRFLIDGACSAIVVLIHVRPAAKMWAAFLAHPDRLVEDSRRGGARATPLRCACFWNQIRNTVSAL
jgi:hypothetical protein